MKRALSFYYFICLLLRLISFGRNREILRHSPKRFVTCSVAGITPVSMYTGSLPVTASEVIRARGVNPCRSTAASDAMSSAAAPSEICEAVAAVTAQPSRSGLSPAIFSSEVSRRGPSSVVTPATGRDLAGEPALVDGADRALVALQRELFELAAAQPPLLADQLGPAELGDLLGAVPLLPALPERQRHALLHRQAHRRTHRHLAHALHAGRHDQVLGARQHPLRGEVHGLLRGSALPVDGHPGHVFRQPGGQPRGPGDVDGLRADLGHAAHDHVLDRRRVSSGACDELAQHMRGQVSRVHCGQAAVALAYRGTYRVNDVCLSHDVLQHVRGAAGAGSFRRAGLLTSLLTSRLPGPPHGHPVRILARIAVLRRTQSLLSVISDYCQASNGEAGEHPTMGSTDDVVGLVSIGQLAKAAGVSSRTIRYYEELGILPEPQRTGGGTRKYPREYCGYIETALALKDLGFRLEEVKPLARLALGRAIAPGQRARPPSWWKTGSKRWTGRWPCCANCATASTTRPPPGPVRSTCAPWVTLQPALCSL